MNGRVITKTTNKKNTRHVRNPLPVINWQGNISLYTSVNNPAYMKYMWEKILLYLRLSGLFNLSARILWVSPCWVSLDFAKRRVIPFNPSHKGNWNLFAANSYTYELDGTRSLQFTTHELGNSAWVHEMDTIGQFLQIPAHRTDPCRFLDIDGETLQILRMRLTLPKNIQEIDF